MSILIRLAFCLFCLNLVSCATVTRGTTEDVVIRTTPEDATVVTSLNHTCTRNPCVVNVDRKKSFQVTASKPGYITRTVDVGTRISGKGGTAMAGNVLVGGVVGIGVDAATGAGRDHWPNPVVITLARKGSAKDITPQAPAAPAKKATKKVPVS